MTFREFLHERGRARGAAKVRVQDDEAFFGGAHFNEFLAEGVARREGSSGSHRKRIEYQCLRISAMARFASSCFGALPCQAVWSSMKETPLPLIVFRII